MAPIRELDHRVNIVVEQVIEKESEAYCGVIMTCHNFPVHGSRGWKFAQSALLTDMEKITQSILLGLNNGQEEHYHTGCTKQPLVSVVIGSNIIDL